VLGKGKIGWRIQDESRKGTEQEQKKSVSGGVFEFFFS
jgi:hypothetical protein